MQFHLEKSIEILERTPSVIEAMLGKLSPDWTMPNEGPETWSVFDIVGHLVHGEKTDWIPRIEIILNGKADKTFTPFDRFAQFSESKGKTLNQLLEEFRSLRKKNIALLKAKKVNSGLLALKGNHPALGEVSLSQLLATWTVHDLNHLAQIARVMAHQYEQEVGPWIEYLGILNRHRKP